MEMRKLLLLALAVVLSGLDGCKPDIGSEIVLLGFVMEINDPHGASLLKRTDQSAITEKSINHYYLIDGESILQNNGSMAFPKNIRIGEDSRGKAFLEVFFDAFPDKKGHVTSILEYTNGYQADTLRASIVRNGGLISFQNVWLNGSQIWGEGIQTKIPVIVK